MKTRALGQTGLNVSEIGFGGWGIGGAAEGAVAYGATSDGESLASLRRAYDLGITFYDTAPLYGYGHSERLMGEAFSGVRSNVLIATKAGLLDAQDRQDFSVAHLERSLEESLGRLRTDYVDLFLLHSPPLESIAENRPLLLAGEAAGRWANAGVGNFRAFSGRRTAGRGTIGLQGYRGQFQSHGPACPAERPVRTVRGEKRGSRLLRTPLCYGFLTGRYADTTGFSAADHRSRWSPEQRQLWRGPTSGSRRSLPASRR